MPDTQVQNSTGENLEERIKTWDKEKRGLIDDLRTERDKRHSLEKEVEEIRNALNSAAVQPEENSQLEVNRLAAKPREYILETIRPELEARDKTIAALMQEKQFDKAYQWLAKQEKKDVEDIYGSDIEGEIVRITKEHGMGTMTPVEGTKAAYKIYLQELAEKEKDEEKRNERISNNSTQSVKTRSFTGTPRFTRQEIAAMSQQEYQKNEEAILEAARAGAIS